MFRLSSAAIILIILMVSTAFAGEAAANAAHVEVDPETETLFVRAADFAKEKQFVTAVRILTKVMQADSLVSDNDQLYTPVYRAAEKMLLGMPPEALNLYRLANDAEAGALLARAWRDYDEPALRSIVRHYFLTSHGDNAAYRLAGLYIDRHAYQEALALLTMISKRYPDSSIPEKKLKMRLLIAQALHTRTMPELSIDENAITSGIQSLIATAQEGKILDDWPMPFGTPRRDGQHQPVRFSDTENSAWVVTWSHTPPETDTTSQAKTNNAAAGENLRVRIIVNGVPALETQPALLEQSTASIAQRWELGQWLPTDQLVMKNHLAYGSDRDGVYCIDLRSGKDIWRADSRKQLNASNPSFNQYRNGNRTRIQPLSQIERWGFSDRAARSLALAGDSFLYITRGIGPQENQWRIMRGRRVDKQDSKNGDLLTACNADTGRQLWTLGDKQLTGVLFLAGPTPSGSQLLIPFLRQSGLFLAAVGTEKGELLWERYLCDYVDEWVGDIRAAGIAAVNDRAFVVTGQGLIFSLDAADGAILWARRYRRTAVAEKSSFYDQQTQSRASWDNSTCFVTEGFLAALPADSSSIICIDRTTGKVIREIDASGMRYPIGISGDHLIALGSDQVRSIDLAGGEASWSRILRNVSGHALITSEGVYIPGDKSVLILDPADGKQIASHTIAMPEGVPVGNLYVKNDRVLIAGMDSIYSLLDSRPWLQVLTNRITGQDSAQTRMERGLLLMQMRQFADAAADLRIAWQNQTADADKKVVRSRLMICLKNIFKETTDIKALEEVERMTKTASEKVSLDLFALSVFAASGNIEKSTARYRRILKEPAVSLITIGEGEFKRSVDTRVAAGAAMRLAAHGNPQNLEERVEEFTGVVENSSAGLYRLMTSFPTTRAGATAGVDAARMYKQHRLPALAEQVLLELCRSPEQRIAATGTAALARFYQTADLPYSAQREWKRLRADFDKTPLMQELLQTTGDEVTGGALAETHLTRAAEDRKKLSPPGRRIPSPPHRLLWKHTEESSMILIHHEGERSNEFMDSHILIGSVSLPQAISCLRLKDGITRWHLALPTEGKKANFQFNGDVTRMGNLLLLNNQKQVIAIDLLAGAKAWEWVPGSQIQEISKDGSGLVVVYTLNHGRQYINILDPVTGFLRWRQSFYRLSGMQVKPGRQCLAFAPSYSHNGPARAILQDRFTGEELATVKTETSLIWLHHSVIGRRKGKLFIKHLPPRGNEISLGLANVKVMATRAGEKRICLIRTDQRLSMIDSNNGDFLWTTPENKAYGPISGTVYVPEEDELMVFSRADGKKQVLVIDAKTGTNTATLDLTDQQNWNPRLAAGGRLIAVMEMGMQQQRGVGSSYVFFDKDTNKLIPDTFLPKAQHIDPKGRFTNYQLFIAGDRLLVYNSKVILAYGHGTPRKQTTSEKDATGIYGKDSW